ncbi:Stk1 family PASTA domain-containing Ser/Thr kinase [Streptomyces sp. N2-109]|uniref:non-specific serine/threonine protein kinase n=1 Tax=Streptomyces gossypii TaxID=2883101 RepID=A0ABT2JZM0_9ACTN|nr:Stk1 family PASTA domain-containing Ser/Thr kinase [Streptomyces gossypii]MCT2593357.1 Stk1 family PASTA domain-containing Ser/Thr kinase [Streptomyces gossypii]
MDATLHDPIQGQVLDGRYRVDARIAVGGMATVYRALDTRLDRVLALKVMHPSLAADRLFVDRFIREAKSVARLAHPNVVGVFDQGTDGTYVYLAMEYVAGCTLRDVLRDRRALQPRAALDVLEPILAALGAAHRAGLVHRDMKPENVLIGDDGRVKVADFGLVRTVDGQTSATTDSILGTVSYLAPEQIEHGQADPRTDLYACGVMLHEMLTGGKPHSGSTPAQVLYKHLHEDVPAPSAAVPGLAAALDGLVARAAARDPEQRPEDAVALLSEVRAARAALTDEQLDAVPPQANEADEPGAEHLTSVIPRSFGLSTAPAAPDPGFEDTTGSAELADSVHQDDLATVPGDAGYGPETNGVHHTTRLASPPAEPPAVPPPGPGAPGRAGRRRPKPAMLALLGVVLVLLLGTGIWYINSGQFTQTPAVLDMTESKARDALEEKGLDVRVERAHSEAIERGHVVKSDPKPGERVRGNGTVTIVVSRGPDIVKVPDLSGKPLSDAKAQLKDDGLKPGLIKREFDPETAQGSVIRTDPKAGAEKRPGAAVALTVSKGREIGIPDVTGEDEASAREDLEEVGLKVRIAQQRVFSDEDEGDIAKQSPGQGAIAAKGDTVTLTVSKGPDMVEVPDVEGMSESDAREALEGAGFTVNVNTLFIRDKVFNQSPDSGDEAARGSEVTIWVQ